MTIPASVARARRQAKVDALAARASLAGERQAAEAASARLRGAVGPLDPLDEPAPIDPHLNAEEEAEVIRHLQSLGYELVPTESSRLHGRLNRKLIETDEQANGVKTYLQDATVMRRLGSGEAADFWRKITSGKRIMMPERHPSGHRSTEMAHTTVSALSAGVASQIRSRK
jgi:hypothetical protein